MTSDPALFASRIPTDVLLLNHMEVSAKSVYLFDFDGVVSSRFEDDIYKLPPTRDEVDLIDAAAHQFKINCAGMEQRYQRHLLYQAAAWKLRIPIEPGPGFSAARFAGLYSRLFILTARSGWYASERLRSFLENHKIVPIEIYNIGRVIKDRQIELVCREFQTQQVYFIEDSPIHLATAIQLHISNLVPVSVDHDPKATLDESYLRTYYCNVLERAVSTWGDDHGEWSSTE
jgi:hypothetical protein